MYIDNRLVHGTELDGIDVKISDASMTPSVDGNVRPNRLSATNGSASWNSWQQEKSSTQSRQLLSETPLPHLKDLQAQAESRIQDFDIFVPITRLLGSAKSSIDRVHTDVTYKKPHSAYIEYLVGSHIILNIIPRHKDFPTIRTDRKQWAPVYNALQKQISSQQAMIEDIKDMIEENNIKFKTVSAQALAKSSSQSTSNANGQYASNVSSRPTSMPRSLGAREAPGDELFLPPQSSSNAVRSSQGKIPEGQVQYDERGQKAKPPIQPKPDSLHARSISQSAIPHGTGGDALSERFSQFRIQPKPTRDDAETSRPSKDLAVEMPSPTEFVPRRLSNNIGTDSRPSERDLYSPSKPLGPRDMPFQSHIPQPPPKIPLGLHSTVNLPRAPSPAYDPSKSVVPPINTNFSSVPPRTEVNGYDSQTPRSLKRWSGQKALTDSVQLPSRSASTTPKPQLGQTIITASELYDSLRTTNILIIDVRNRAEFDDGHIHARSVMCIEPLTLKSGISAEDLEDRLVVSPEVEQNAFEHRNEFDLIVYYDQKTSTNRFLQGHPSRAESYALRALYDTLYEFNHYKPLQRPPAVLAGGLDAWIDLFGPQALATSTTSAITGPRKTSRKAGRPIGRVPMASANSSLEVRRRRLREQTPLNADEERKWLEKVRDEQVNLADYQEAQSDGETDAGHEEPPSPFIHSIEDFLRRFPEASTTQQSMSGPMPLPPPPPPPRKTVPPNLPAPPPLPSIPARPPPALPRPSYSGVSERESVQASPTTRQSSTQYPLFTPRSTSRFLKLPHTGLINFGVTCYMNATIQCLLATIPLSQLFLDNRWRNFVQKNWKGSNGILPEIFANLIRSLWRDDWTAIRPTSLRSFCGRLKQDWGEDRQQDAKEFFDFVVDCLHEDLNMNFDRHPLQPLTAKAEATRERMPIRTVSRAEWDRYSHREQSPISEFFAGQHASRLRCRTCGHTSTTYEAFYSISVEIPRVDRKQGWDIHDCLRSYTQEERLSRDEMWRCPHCKCEREATKQIILTRAPNFLVVHFKRFEMRKGESAKKVHTPIGFPLFGLDMGNYMIPPPPPPPPAATEDAYSSGREAADQFPDLAMTPPYLYDAYAVMRHIGNSGNSGHYISLVRDASRGCWRRFDDDRVTDFDPAKLKPDHRLQNEQAYIVFYCRVPAR